MSNNLGVNSDNMKYLGHCMKLLPNNLKKLNLLLHRNGLADNAENLK